MTANRNFLRYSSGFSLVELIVVIIILGILAAVALPKFFDITAKAELSLAKGVAGGLQASVKMVQAAFILQGYTTRVQNLPDYGDASVDTNNIGFPIGIDKGSVNENIGKGNAGCVGLWEGLLLNHPSVSHDNNNQDYRSYRHTGNKVCSYVYRAGGDMGNQNTGKLVIKYDSRDGSVIVCGTRSDIPNC